MPTCALIELGYSCKGGYGDFLCDVSKCQQLCKKFCKRVIYIISGFPFGILKLGISCSWNLILRVLELWGVGWDGIKDTHWRAKDYYWISWIEWNHDPSKTSKDETRGLKDVIWFDNVMMRIVNLFSGSSSYPLFLVY